jgi:hypothetical protein
MAEFPYAVGFKRSYQKMMKVEIDENWWKVSQIKRRDVILEQQVTASWLKFMAKSINWTTEIEELNSMITMRNGLCLACGFLIISRDRIKKYSLQKLYIGSFQPEGGGWLMWKLESKICLDIWDWYLKMELDEIKIFILTFLYCRYGVLFQFILEKKKKKEFGI